MIGLKPGWSNSYTHSPELHANPLLGSLQLFCWLFFHPTAWRNYLARIDPALSPNFAVTDLRRSHWRNTQMRWLLVIGYGILPGLAGLFSAFVLWLMGLPGQSLVLGGCAALALGMGVSVTGSIIIGTAASITLGPVAGLFSGLMIGLGPASGWVIINSSELEVTVRALASGGVFGLGGGTVGYIASGAAGKDSTHSLGRQFAGAVISVLFGGVILFTARYNLPLIERNTTAAGLMIGTTVGLVVSWRRGPLAGLVVILLVFLGFASAIAAGGGTALEIVLFVTLIVLPYLLGEQIAGPWVGAVASALGGGGGWIAAIIAVGHIPRWSTLALSVLTILLGLTLPWWRFFLLYPFLTVWNAWLGHLDKNRPNRRPSLLRWHSAFWDEHQPLRLLGLDKHLLRVIEHNPVEGQLASEFLSASRQRWAAQAAQIELEARWLESCTEVPVIGSVHRSLSAGELAGPASALLRSFSRLSQDVLAALRQESSYNQRLALSTVEDRLDALLRELTRSSEPYALRFRPIATQWRQIIAVYIRQLEEVVETRQEIDNPYVIGLPLTEQQEIFVGRTGISTRIEQLLLGRRSPPLLLYGQRRMGKTSLLNNLGRLLPTTIIPLFVDLQGPASQATDHAGFLYNLARGMITSAQRQRNLTLPPLNREALTADPFTGFDEWLDQVEAELGQNTALLALDEFEALEIPLVEGRFSEAAVLGMFRHLIQHRPRFKVLLTGSHALDEFERWASYLINVQMIHISYLTEAEARQLIERPVKNFPLRYEPEASRRVFALTRGHPALTQLLCAEIVALKNEQEPSARRHACLAEVEAALPRALSHGNFFFADIERNQVTPEGAALLRFIANHGEGAVVSRESLARQLPSPADLSQTLALLTQRELLEAIEGGYRFQVEMIRRWFSWGFEF